MKLFIAIWIFYKAISKNILHKRSISENIGDNNMKSTKRIKIIAWIMIFCLAFSWSSVPVSAANEQDYEKIINNYYELINNSQYSDICDLYGVELNNFVADFFSNEENAKTHSGIYNVKNAQVLVIQNITATAFAYDDGFTTYSDTQTFFVKCDMDVFSSDKYYTEGNNYFLFSIGVNSNGEVKIVNIEIPNYKIIEAYDTQTEDIMAYKQIRNYYIYGDRPAVLSDAPVYIDYVRNPSKIRVLYNGSVKSVTFSDYCLTVAANEMNTLTNIDGQRAAAMAIKMFAIHYVNSAASGSNYDINSTVQVYKEGVTISAGAKNAMNYIMDYFLLDYYGANFKTFYRTSESNSSYCKQYGGILAQKESDSMGAGGKSWKDILRHYYTRVSNVSYYNSQMNMGALIITTQHTHDWGSGTICSHCGAIAK